MGSFEKYQHIERLGSEEVDGLICKGPLVVQEKLDGSCLTVMLGDDGNPLIASRKNVIHQGGATLNEFRGAVEYVTNHRGIMSVLSRHNDWVIRGEFLVKHTINYAPEAWKKFYVFDVQRTDGGYVPVWEYMHELEDNDIKMVPLIGIFSENEVRAESFDAGSPIPSIEELVKMADRQSVLGDNKAEGIVVKRYDFVDKYGRTTWGKVVTSEFKQEFKSLLGHQCSDPGEEKFVSMCVTETIIRKVIANIESSEGRKLQSSDIARVLGTVWHDAVNEEIWGFIRKVKNPVVDFGRLRKLTEDKTRSFVIAYLSGGV